MIIFLASFLFVSLASAASNLGVLQEDVVAGKILSVGLNASSTGNWYIGSISNSNIVSARMASGSLVVTGLNPGSAKILACTDIQNNHCLEVNVVVSASGRVLGAYTGVPHSPGSWVINGPTVFYVDANGLIPITTWKIFLDNGGKANLIVPANPGDLTLPLEAFMTQKDLRVK